MFISKIKQVIEARKIIIIKTGARTERANTCRDI